MTKIQLTLEIERISPKTFSATATTSDGHQGLGTGSDLAVSGYKAVKSALECYADEREQRGQPEVEEPRARQFVPTHYILAGLHEDQRCMVLDIAGQVNGKVKSYRVQYEDGSEGDEKVRFIRPINPNWVFKKIA